MFDDVYHVDEAPDTEWMRTTLQPALLGVVALFGEEGFFPLLAEDMLREFLAVPARCIASASESVAETGVAALKALLAAAGTRFSPDMWACVCRTLARLFEDGAPPYCSPYRTPYCSPYRTPYCSLAPAARKPMQRQRRELQPHHRSHRASCAPRRWTTSTL